MTQWNCALTYSRSHSHRTEATVRVVDPTGLGGALAGYGDQRNYELFIELADLVVLKGDLALDPKVIRSPTLVFKDGIGYAPRMSLAR